LVVGGRFDGDGGTVMDGGVAPDVLGDEEVVYEMRIGSVM
jgi:hypothetical protein